MRCQGFLLDYPILIQYFKKILAMIYVSDTSVTINNKLIWKNDVYFLYLLNDEKYCIFIGRFWSNCRRIEGILGNLFLMSSLSLNLIDFIIPAVIII